MLPQGNESISCVLFLILLFLKCSVLHKFADLIRLHLNRKLRDRLKLLIIMGMYGLLGVLCGRCSMFVGMEWRGEEIYIGLVLYVHMK